MDSTPCEHYLPSQLPAFVSVEAERDEYKAMLILLMSDLAWADGWIQSVSRLPRSFQPTIDKATALLAKYEP